VGKTGRGIWEGTQCNKEFSAASGQSRSACGRKKSRGI